MKITRKGSGANHSFRPLEFKNPKLSSNSKNKVIEIRSFSIPDFASETTHNYMLQMSLSEVNELRRIMGDERVSSYSNEFRQIMGDERVSPCSDDIVTEFADCLKALMIVEKFCNGTIHSNGGSSKP